MIALGPAQTADLDTRLDETLEEGRRLADVARGIRHQRDYQRWSDEVLTWRTATARTLEAGFATMAVRDALLELWSSNAPLCTTWLDSFATEREQLHAALDFAERVRRATFGLIA